MRRNHINHLRSQMNISHKPLHAHIQVHLGEKGAKIPPTKCSHICKQLSKSPLEQGNSSCFLRFSCESEQIPVKSLYNFQEIPAIQRGPKCGEISYQQMYTQLASINKLKFPGAEEFSIVIAKRQICQPTRSQELNTYNSKYNKPHRGWRACPSDCNSTRRT